ncbi:MAG TPA: glycoside hydrolase family 2 protein, partial [Beijerinckiaceae bacterium]|nr:glycoside hydrolase family 2 protein [Beijerinckiaceae bacterium]
MPERSADPWRVAPPEPLVWTLALSPPGAWAAPADIPEEAEQLQASVPGTVADALREAGRFDLMDPPDLDRCDAWYRARVHGAGRRRLSFGGLATLAEVWIGDQRALTSNSMFIEHEFDWDFLSDSWLAIAFRALGPHLDAPGPRARWRPRNIVPSSLRLWRTTLLGRMPGWQPPVYALGPWRPIAVRRIDEEPALCEIDLRTSLQGANGVLDAVLRVENDDCAQVRLSCGDREVLMSRDGDGRLRGRLELEDVALWWPHTHGKPQLYEVEAQLGGVKRAIGRVGFRRIALDHAEGQGFGLIVNGAPIFCRGAVWTTPDIVALPCSRQAYEPLLRAMQDANLNMVRISGAMTYEASPFFDLCDELGLLVWQDFMFSNFDYPASDRDFIASARLEAEQFLRRTRASPSLAVLCGGSEMAQQAAMLGMPERFWRNSLFDETLAEIAAKERPDCLYIAQTPSGGVVPFEPAAGVCHYYGVSAYRRPLDDARRAGVRFAAEGLGHANLSDVAAIVLVRDAPAVAQPCWGERRPGDVGALWFFEDVRNHYLHELYGLDPAALRVQDPERYIDLSRATNAELIEEVFALWRRCGSPTRGGLVWFWRDLVPCAGWGFLDSDNHPKSVWYALRRAARPVQALLTDEGLSGLRVHLLNETERSLEAELSLVCLRAGETPVMRAKRALQLEPRSAIALSDFDLWGAFFDTNYAYRFGPPAHDVTIARLRDRASGTLLAEAFHFPLGRGHDRQTLGLEVALHHDPSGWSLTLSARRFAQSVHIDDPAFRGEDDWFHLPPGEPRRVRLIAR